MLRRLSDISFTLFQQENAPCQYYHSRGFSGADRNATLRRVETHEGRSAAAPAAEPSGIARVRKPTRFRALGSVDVQALRRQVGRLSERVWRQEDAIKENAYRCFDHTQHIVFRFIKGNRDPRRFYSQPSWAVWSPMLLAVMEPAAAPYRFQEPAFPKVMLARLKAGHVIERHDDGETGCSHPFVHKIHVPLETNPGALVHVDGKDLHLEVGQAWEINNLARHGAVNRGRTDRIHLVFEVFEGAQVTMPEDRQRTAART